MRNNRRLLGLTVAFLLTLSSLIYPSASFSANLTNTKDVLQSSRMSFAGRVIAPTAVGSSNVWIYTSAAGNFTSVSTAGLKPGDTLTIGANTYTIVSIVSTSQFTVTPALQAGDADDQEAIYYLAKPKHQISFTTASAVENGFFQVLVAAGNNDSIPDITGFDFAGGVTATASSITNYTFVAGVATAAGDTGCAAGYHCFEFHYSGAGDIGKDILLTIGLQDGTNTMIAPAPSSSRVANTADSYTYIIKNFVSGADPATATPVDSSTGKIAVIEPVRVTATVDPSITFKIEGIAASETTCGLTTSVTTTATAVPFGVMALDTFKVAAQKITVSTNAVSGYAVTAIENNRMSNLAASPSYIPDTTCDNGSCDHDTSDTWATAADNAGLGYTVAAVAAGPTVAPIDLKFQHFPSVADNEPPFQIMSHTTIASSHAMHVCYQLSVDATQPAGNYENQITYTATASF